MTTENEQLSELLDELEMAAVAYLEDHTTRKTRLKPARAKVESLFSRATEERDRLQREVKAMSEMYTQVTAPLQECCQKYKLGLGGEMCHELVIEEIERLRQFETYVCQVIAMGDQAHLTVEDLPK
jgi:hypothetical protein